MVLYFQGFWFRWPHLHCPSQTDWKVIHLSRKKRHQLNMLDIVLPTLVHSNKVPWHIHVFMTQIHCNAVKLPFHTAWGNFIISQTQKSYSMDQSPIYNLLKTILLVSVGYKLVNRAHDHTSCTDLQSSSQLHPHPIFPPPSSLATVLGN